MSPMTENQYTEVAVDKLKIGHVLGYPVFQHDQLLLLSTGTIITPRVVRLLHQHGIETVKIHSADAASIGDSKEREEGYTKPIEGSDQFYKKLTGTPKHSVSPRAMTLFKSANSLRMDAEIRARGKLTRTPHSGGVHIRSRPVTDIKHLHEAIAQRDAREEAIAEKCRELQYEIVHRARVDAGPILRILDAELSSLTKEPDLFCLVTRAPSASPYPGLHSLLVARMSMAIAAHLNWTRQEILALGLGAICHDTGMLRISDRLYRTRNRIDSLQRQDLVKHPILALDLVGLDNDLDEYVRYIVYQMHERCNGSGYPRGWTMSSIHPAARLVGLADAFVAMISQRPHRNPLLPHQAILEIMQETHAGLWEPAITRGLLRAVSLYPLGSFVELSDGRIARSIQINAKDDRRPRMEVWIDPAAIALEPGEVLDLASQPQLTVSRAIAPPQII